MCQHGTPREWGGRLPLLIGREPHELEPRRGSGMGLARVCAARSCTAKSCRLRSARRGRPDRNDWPGRGAPPIGSGRLKTGQVATPHGRYHPWNRARDAGDRPRRVPTRPRREQPTARGRRDSPLKEPYKCFPPPMPDSERGFALAVVVLVLLVLSLFAVLFMRTITVDTTVSGYGVSESRALTFADDGIAEAISRIRSGDVPDNLNPRMVTQIYLAVAGAVPALGADSTAVATAQPAGTWLNYSTAERSSD